MSSRRQRVCAFVCLVTLVAALLPMEVFAQQTVYLKTPNDLQRLSKNCRDEGYSSGLVVILENDIDMHETPFSPIPYFGGRFEGGGHSVSGLSIDFEGSEAGMFRHLGAGAEVMDLRVEVSMDLDEMLSSIGGLAGENSGTVSGCTVFGVVKGGERVGGIVGYNLEGGRIENCTNEVEVSGGEQTGGIVGNNAGTVSGCVNRGAVNNRSKKSDSKSSKLLSGFNFHTEEIRLSGRTLYNATGGIAGQNDALIEGCINYGKVGYAHVGNRSGGIAGLQGGKLTSCVNYGAVEGKRNVGGIAGQFLPDTQRQYGQSKIENLSDEVTELGDLLRRYGSIVRNENIAQDVRDAGNALDDIRERLNQTGKDTNNRTQDLLDNLEVQGDRLQASADIMTEQLEAFSDKANPDVDGMIDCLEEIRVSLDKARDIKDVVDDGMEKSVRPQLDAIDKDIQKTLRAVNDIADELSNVEELLRDARRIVSGNKDLSEMAEELAKLFQSIAAEDISRALNEAPLAAQHIEKDAEVLRESMAVLRVAESGNPQTGKFILEILPNICFAEEMESDFALRQAEEADLLLNQIQEVLHSRKTPEQKRTQASQLLRVMISQLNGAAEDGADVVAGLEAQLQAIREIIQKTENEIANGGSLAQDLAAILARLKEAEQRISDLLREYQTLLQKIQSAAEFSQKALKIIAEHKEAAEAVKQLNELFREFGGVQISVYVKRVVRAADHMNDQFQEMREGISDTSDEVSGLVADRLDELDQAAEKLSGYARDFSQSAKTLSDSMTGEAREVRDALSIIGDKTNQWASDTGNSVRSTADFVNDNLDIVSRQLNRITDSAEVISDKFSDNSDTVRNRLDRVRDAASELGERPDRKVEENTQLDTARERGLILNCVNNGSVSGDICIGGIIGAVSLLTGALVSEDGDEAESEEENILLDETVALTCMMYDCKNSADVAAKREYAGGILGYGRYGTLFHCLSTGDISSDEGGFVGGIAGMSDSLTEGSAAMGTLRGVEYIGGIAGHGKDIKNCYTMILIPDGGEKTGAIAGEFEGELVGNYFVREELAGVDGVDYPDRAMPLEYEELIALEAVPDEFRNLRVSFLIDGETVASYPIIYGQAFDSSLIPSVPEREGGYGKWQDFDTERVIRSLKIQLEYVPWTKTISTGGRKPVMLAEGAFTENAVIEARPWQEEKKPRGYRALDGYVFAVEDEGNSMAEHFSARVYNPYDDNIKVMIKKGDGWEEVKYTTDGSYLVFPAEKTGTFLLVKRSMAGWIMVLSVLALLIAAAVWLFIKKQKTPHVLGARG